MTSPTNAPLNAPAFIKTPISNINIQYIRELARIEAGIIINSNKADMMYLRLQPLAVKHGFKNINDFIGSFKSSSNSALKSKVMEALTTNETFFFRDKYVFEALRKEIIPNLLKTRSRARSLRIWCAAASSGQEPYSLAMILKEFENQLKDWNYEIVATDISTDILEQAKAGRYNDFEAQRGVTPDFLLEHFTKSKEHWVIDPALKRNITFKKFNLHDKLRTLGSFDLIFCRNVLIYFDKTQKISILNQMAAMLPKDGLLVLGSSEGVFSLTERFMPSDYKSIYKLVDS